MTPESLGQMLEAFLGCSRHAVGLEDGAIVFDLLESKYSISGEYNKGVLRLWSAERNAVRRVLYAELRNGHLRLMVQRLGQARPSKLEICQRAAVAVSRRPYTAHPSGDRHAAWLDFSRNRVDARGGRRTLGETACG